MGLIDDTFPRTVKDLLEKVEYDSRHNYVPVVSTNVDRTMCRVTSSETYMNQYDVETFKRMCWCEMWSGLSYLVHIP